MVRDDGASRLLAGQGLKASGALLFEPASARAIRAAMPTGIPSVVTRAGVSRAGSLTHPDEYWATHTDQPPDPRIYRPQLTVRLPPRRSAEVPLGWSWQPRTQRGCWYNPKCRPNPPGAAQNSDIWRACSLAKEPLESKTLPSSRLAGELASLRGVQGGRSTRLKAPKAPLESSHRELSDVKIPKPNGQGTSLQRHAKNAGAGEPRWDRFDTRY